MIRFEVSPATFARLRQVQQVLADERGGQLDDDALVETLCAAVLDGSTSEVDQGRARHQILTTICDACLQGWQQGAGRAIAVTATDVEIAECDAQWVGSDREPGLAKQDIPPKTRRYVFNRDHHRCKVPGCRSARNLDVHHIVPRYLGGGHEPENLVLLCSGHHRSHHDGALLITGRAPDLTMTWRLASHVGRPEDPHGAISPDRSNDAPHVGHAADRHGALPAKRSTPRSPPVLSGERSNKYEHVVMRTEAIQALATAGFPKAQARAFVDGALEVAPSDVTLEGLLVLALQRSRTS